VWPIPETLIGAGVAMFRRLPGAGTPATEISLVGWVRAGGRGVSVALLLAGCGAPAAPPQTEATAARPNIVVLVVDDLRFDEFGAAGHPYLETPNIDRLAAEGALFTKAFHAVSLCSPNRATLLTGQFPSRHGIIDNVSRSLASHRLETFPQALQAAGYRTAFLGKWHMGNDPTPRPGFDYWAALPGQGRSVDPELFEGGRLQVVPGYATDLLTDRAIGFIEREKEHPFLVYLAHKAVHPDVTQRDDGSIAPGSEGGYIPAPRHLGRYDDRRFPRRANSADSLARLGGMPAVQRALATLVSGSDSGPADLLAAPRTEEETIRRRAEMILAVDEGLGRIMATLDSLGILDRTAILFTSDNGFFFGEHGLSTERRLPYEESIRNPLLLRYPPRVKAGSRPAGLALTVDVAPTLLELAGVAVGPQIQGRSLVPLFAGTPPGWRESVLVEFYTYENPFPHLLDMDYRAVRTDRYKYIHWIKHPEMDELYDLVSDSLELSNVADDPAMAGVKSRLKAELGRLVLQAMGLTER
jgi:N-acetylglucosamine-6-sulfatase